MRYKIFKLSLIALQIFINYNEDFMTVFLFIICKMRS